MTTATSFSHQNDAGSRMCNQLGVEKISYSLSSSYLNLKLTYDHLYDYYIAFM